MGLFCKNLLGFYYTTCKTFIHCDLFVFVLQKKLGKCVKNAVSKLFKNAKIQEPPAWGARAPFASLSSGNFS